MENLINVEGMTCMHCVKSVESVVKEVKGVESVDVNLDDGTVKITGEDYDLEEIKESIDDIGFTVK